MIETYKYFSVKYIKKDFIKIAYSSFGQYESIEDEFKARNPYYVPSKITDFVKHMIKIDDADYLFLYKTKIYNKLSFRKKLSQIWMTGTKFHYEGNYLCGESLTYYGLSQSKSYMESVSSVEKIIIVSSDCKNYSNKSVIEDIEESKPKDLKEFIQRLMQKYDGITIVEESFYGNEDGKININIYGKIVNYLNIEQIQKELNKLENYTIYI